MNLTELKEAQKGMGDEERKKRYLECLNSGGCARKLEKLAISGTSADEYCHICLTHYSHGFAVDAPDV